MGFEALNDCLRPEIGAKTADDAKFAVDFVVKLSIFDKNKQKENIQMKASDLHLLSARDLVAERLSSIAGERRHGLADRILRGETTAAEVAAALLSGLREP